MAALAVLGVVSAVPAATPASAFGKELRGAGVESRSAARAATTERWSRYGLRRGKTAISLSDIRTGGASAHAGSPLMVTVVHRPRRRARPRSRGDVYLTHGPRRRCARSPGADRGRSVMAVRGLRAGSAAPYLAVGTRRTFPAGRRRFCAWVRSPGKRRLSRPVARDVTFYTALFGAYAVGLRRATDGRQHDAFAIRATHPVRSEYSSQGWWRSGECSLRSNGETTSARAAGIPQGLSVLRSLAAEPGECPSDAVASGTVMAGPLAGRSTTFRVRDGGFAGPQVQVSHHEGDCMASGALAAGYPAREAQAVREALARLGCRPGRIIAARRSRTAPATGDAYAVTIHGKRAELAPAGTKVDVVVDAASGGSPPPPPIPPEPKPPKDVPYPGLPAPVDAPGCSPKVETGELEAVSPCWRQRGDVYETEGRARLNGIDLTPARSGIAIRIDARSQRVTSSGPVEVRVGRLRLYRGKLRWRGPSQVFEIKGKSARRDPGEPFDTRDLQIFGLPVDGSAELLFSDGRTQLKASIEIPDEPTLSRIAGFAGWSGDITAAATNDAGLVLDGAKVELPGARAGFVELQDAELSVARQADGAHHFDGAATLYPFRFARMGLSGELGFGTGDGYFKVGAGLENLNRLLVHGFFLQRVAFTLQIDPFGLTGAAAVTFGPQFRLDQRLVSAARMDGSLAYLAGASGQPGSLELSGDLELAELEIASGKVSLTGGLVDIEGDASLKVGGYGLDGRLVGWVDGLRAFNLEGKAVLVMPGPDQGGEAVVSTRGVGACRRGFGPDVGFGYRWGAGVAGIDLFALSCDLGTWRELEPGAGASAAQASAARSFRIRRGTKTLALSAVGAGSAPNVAFIAPDGQRFEPSAAPDGAVATDRVLLVQDGQTATTAFAMDRPPAGRWRIVALPGSAPVRSYRAAPSLGPVRISARVSRRGAARVLRYRLRNLRGARVTFVEEGRDVRRVIGRTGRAKGRMRFRPSTGPGGRRRVIAFVERAGRPTGRRSRVARFRVGTLRPRRPRGVRVRRTRRLARVITWRGPRRLRYLVTVRTADGRRLRFVRPGSRRRVAVPHVPRRQRMRVRIAAQSPTGTLSRVRKLSTRR